MKSAIVLFGFSALVYGTWLVPILINYLQLGGYVNTTHVGAVILGPLELVVSWGTVVPFALYGVAILLPKSFSDNGARIPLAIIVVTGLVMLTNGVSWIFGSAFLTLGRDHRYWGLLYLGVALYAAVGGAVAYARIRRMRLKAVGVSAAVVVLGIMSPFLGSYFYSEKFPPDRLLHTTLQGERTLLSAMDAYSGRRCVVAVPNNGLARRVSAYSGYRLVLWIRRRAYQNWARIRWRDIYERIPGDQERLRDNRILTGGRNGGQEFRAVVDKYHVNLIVTRAVNALVFRGYRKTIFPNGQAPIALIHISSCPP